MAELKTIMIAGVEFQAPFKYAEGHVLTEVEAKALNQTRFENLRNNFAALVKASQEGKEGAIPAADLPAKFAEYEASYEFAAPGAGGSARALDPIEREAKTLATDVVKTALKNKGKSWNPPKEASEEDKAAFIKNRDDKVAEIMARDAVIAQARKNVAQRQKGLDAITADLDL